jgi:hypothetical protein
MGAKAKPDLSVTLGGSLMHEREPDFSGYATKAGLKCSDGRTIMKDAFKHQDKLSVPLVWAHGHSEPSNVLGHTMLENRDDGVYCYGFFNDTEQGKNAKTLVQHEDIKHLSIYANQLVEKAANVLHGMIREVSLVMAGANPGAFIDNVSVQHSDGDVVTLSDEVIVYTDEVLEHADEPGAKKEEKEEDGPTVQEVYDGMSEEEQAVVHYMVGAALEEAGTAEHSDKSEKKEGTWMSRNVFEQQKEGKKDGPGSRTLSHDEIKGIVDDAQKNGSLKGAVEAFALKHGIENIEVLFPDARAVDATPEFDKRRTEWVSGVINGTKHSPFSRIKSLVADLTFDEARAKGYIKGNFKKEEWFGVSKRVTTPSTVYKKQKLDRDDIIDITDFDVVAWLKGEMRIMLDEELARAVLIGDGREVDDEDKIKDPFGAVEGAGIRSIANDHDLYAGSVYVNIDDADSSPEEIVEAIIRSMGLYKGSGSPTFYTTLAVYTELILAKDGMGRRLWNNKAELASAMGVSNIVEVEVMEDEPEIVGIIVNLKDYTLGADKGGDVAFFDDFDIDYNQYKYLLETRLSGALTKIRSALVVKKVDVASVLVKPTKPAFANNNITVPTVTGVVYHRGDTDAVMDTATPIALAAGQSLRVYAVPATPAYYFADNVNDEWTFKNSA